MEQKIPIRFIDWGLKDYGPALEAMQALRDERLEGGVDTVIFVEHPAVITTGRRSVEADLLVAPESLAQQKISYVQTDRGGKLTAHEPGQLVIYFVVDIQKRGLSIEKWVWKVEEALRLVLERFGVDATRDKENPGLWVGLKKIVSVGFHVHRGVTTHGVALNVNNALSLFDLFIPCGIEGRGVTSVKVETGKEKDLREVKEAFKQGLDQIL